MKFALFAVTVCASLAVAVTGRKPDIYERPGHLHELRERLGHFKEQPFIDLYKQYATAFVYPLHKDERAKDDYRNYRPSGKECLSFLRGLRVAQYAVKEFNDLIRLDACLGYLFDGNDEEHESDAELSNEDKGHIKTLKEDTVLSDLYTQTKINEMSDEAKSCVSNLLLNNILAKYQYKDQRCNNHFLQLFLQFAECQDGLISKEERESDSYLKILYAVLKDRVHNCYETEIDFIQQAVRNAYGKKHLTRALLKVKNTLALKKSTLSKQQQARMWPTPIMVLLSAVQQTKHEINIRQVHQLIRGIYLGDEILINRFLKHIADFADEQLRPKATDKADEATQQARYQELIDSTCQFFRSSDNEKDYDYATPLIRMVELLNHEDLFDLTAKKFVENMVAKAKDTAPVYLGVSLCNVLTFTEATIPRPNTNAEQHYKVAFFPDTSKMAKWPVAEYF